MKLCIAGEGAMGTNHAQALAQEKGVEIVSLAGGIEADARAFAAKWAIPHWSLELEECLSQPGVEGVILATPNQIHARQAELALSLNKHVFVEIPMGLTFADCEHLVAVARKTDRVCMVNHTRRYTRPFREVYRRVHEGELTLHHIIHNTLFFRRENRNMFGKPRTWTDELLWHQACHTLDFVVWLLEDEEMEAWAQTGPPHPRLNVPMDLTIGLRSRKGVLVSSANSFNNHGPISSNYRFIGEEQTLLIEKGALTDQDGQAELDEGGSYFSPVQEFLDCLRTGRRPITSVDACLPTMRLVDRLQESIDQKSLA